MSILDNFTWKHLVIAIIAILVGIVLFKIVMWLLPLIIILILAYVVYIFLTNYI